MVIIFIMIIILSPQPSSFLHALAFVSSFDTQDLCSLKHKVKVLILLSPNPK